MPTLGMLGRPLVAFISFSTNIWPSPNTVYALSNTLSSAASSRATLTFTISSFGCLTLKEATSPLTAASFQMPNRCGILLPPALGPLSLSVGALQKFGTSGDLSISLPSISNDIKAPLLSLKVTEKFLPAIFTLSSDLRTSSEPGFFDEVGIDANDSFIAY